MFCSRLCCATLLLAGTLTAFAADDYQPGPDSQPQPGVPRGEVTKYQFAESKIFPGTTRDYWVYVLYVADTRGQFVYSFQIQPDGSLAHRQRYFYLHLANGSTQSGADGMTVDAVGRLYVTTEIGLQICDQAGRVNGIVLKPQNKWLSNPVFGGPNLDTLFVTCGDKVYKRKTKATGVLSSRAPIQPPPPRL